MLASQMAYVRKHNIRQLSRVVKSWSFHQEQVEAPFFTQSWGGTPLPALIPYLNLNEPSLAPNSNIVLEYAHFFLARACTNGS